MRDYDEPQITIDSRGADDMKQREVDRDKSATEQTLDLTDELIERLNTSLNQLVRVLAPVLKEDGKGKEAADRAAPAAATPLIRALSMKNEGLGRIINRIQDLTTRVEL